MLATVETGSAGGTGLGAATALAAGALAATVLAFILVSATAARTENTTMAQAMMRRISNLRVARPMQP
jgi:hypothetical protein